MKEIDSVMIDNIRKRKIKINSDIKKKIMLELYNKSKNQNKITIKNFINVYKKYQKNLKKYNLYEVFITLYDENAIVFQSKTCFDGASMISDNLKLYINKFFRNEIKAELKLDANEITKYLLKKIEIQNKETEKISQSLSNYNKDIFTIMALFVSIVALLTANVSALGNLTAFGIITMNLSLIVSIVIIFLLINNIVGNENSRTRNNILGTVFIVILGAILCFIVFNNTLGIVNSTTEKENINNNYNQSFQFDIKGGADI